MVRSRPIAHLARLAISYHIARRTSGRTGRQAGGRAGWAGWWAGGTAAAAAATNATTGEVVNFDFGASMDGSHPTILCPSPKERQKWEETG